MKKINIVGDLEVGGERGRVIYPDGLSSSITATEWKDPQKTVKKVLTCKNNVIMLSERNGTERNGTGQHNIPWW